MSIKVMTLVWDGFPASGTELLIMLAMADWCDDRGGSLYPSIQAVGDKARVGKNHARSILHKFEKDRFLAVVGNHNGGKPGTTREYRLNVVKLKLLADEANAKRDAEKAAKYGTKKVAGDHWEDVFATAPLEVTPTLQGSPTAPPQVLDGSTVAIKTAPLEVTLSTIDPPIEPPSIPAPPAGAPGPLVPIDKPLSAYRLELARAQAAKAEEKTRKALELAAAKDAQKAVQADLRKETWLAFDAAYQARYGTTFLRNARTHCQMVTFVSRVGAESPQVAAFYVARINDPFVAKDSHSLAKLVNGAESYRTQWATGRTAEEASPNSETAYQRSMRLRVAEVSPLLARAAPGEAPKANPTDFFRTVQAVTDIKTIGVTK